MLTLARITATERQQLLIQQEHGFEMAILGILTIFVILPTVIGLSIYLIQKFCFSYFEPFLKKRGMVYENPTLQSFAEVSTFLCLLSCVLIVEGIWFYEFFRMLSNPEEYPVIYSIAHVTKIVLGIILAVGAFVFIAMIIYFGLYPQVVDPKNVRPVDQWELNREADRRFYESYKRDEHLHGPRS